MVRGGRPLLLVVCFQERGKVRVSPRLLPPGKLSVAVGVAQWLQAKDTDAQVGSDLVAQTCAVACQIHKREDHGDPQDDVLIDEAVEVLVEEEEAGPDEGCIW